MPSYRELMSMPHDPLIGAAVRQDRSIKVGQRIVAAIESRRRDPALVAFERGDHTPAETTREVLEQQARDAETMRKQRESLGWIPCNGGESLRGIPFRWIKRNDGRTNVAPLNEHYRARLLMAASVNSEIVAYSTAEECPK